MSQSNTSGYTMEKLQALEESIAEGVVKVKYSDKEVEYRSLDEMMKIAEMMRKKLGLTCKKTNVFGGRAVKMIHSKGL